MVECLQCGTQQDLPYTCNYCGGQYCTQHRLPEKHECDAIDFISPPGEPAFLPIQKYREWRRRRQREEIDDQHNLPKPATRDLDRTTVSKRDRVVNIEDVNDPSAKETQEKKNDRESSYNDVPEPMELEFTVGTRIAPDYEASSEVELKEQSLETDRKNLSIKTLIFLIILLSLIFGFVLIILTS